MSLEAGPTKWEMPKEIRFPISAEEILRKRQALKKELLKQTNLTPSRIAILGGSTTQEVRSILELFLLAQGIQASFYESEYNAYYEEVMFDGVALREFKPDIVFVHTTWHNVSQFPELLEDERDTEELLRREVARFEAFWSRIHSEFGAVIIQNNFDLPRLRPLGNLEASETYGRVGFLQRLNAEFARYARTHSQILINDIHYLSKKCLVLDLDNTLWGGVIGDDGLQGILLGRDHPVGEAYANFQRYVKDLRKRGVLLAVCSKNDLENAKEGFTHPDSILKFEDFSAFKANWNPKSDNVKEIAAELNIGLDSLVFIDDNPVERAIVSAQVPEVAVPEVGSEVHRFAEAIESEGYFEPVKIVQDDIERASYYAANAQRKAYEGAFANYGEFLTSLEMAAEIGAFIPVYLERITQLINKSNQFNLTTRRYTVAEVEAVSQDRHAITLYGRLSDKYGDNGLVSVVIGSVQEDTVEIDLWLMSCRVLKREMEWAMFDALVEECMSRGIRKIRGVYIPSKKNSMVAEHYGGLGFRRLEESSAERTLWEYELSQPYSVKAQHIRRSSRKVMSAVST
jgi:FkbH-like protein